MIQEILKEAQRRADQETLAIFDRVFARDPGEPPPGYIRNRHRKLDGTTRGCGCRYCLQNYRYTKLKIATHRAKMRMGRLDREWSHIEFNDARRGYFELTIACENARGDREWIAAEDDIDITSLFVPADLSKPEHRMQVHLDYCQHIDYYQWGRTTDTNTW